MRYYDIRITTQQGQLVVPQSLKGAFPDTTFTSYVNGKTIGGALDIELDVPVAPYATPQGASRLVVYGISLAEIGQAFDLSLCNITIKAGMQKGLPLANPKYNVGPLVVGTIFQPFGIWEGNVMALEMNLLPPVGTTSQQQPIVYKVERDKPIGPAIQQALQTAFPKFNVTVSVSDKLVAPSEQAGRYEKLSQFSSAIQRFSRMKQFNGITTVNGSPYSTATTGGIQVIIIGSSISVYDNSTAVGATSPSNPIKIAFQDLIGQPTWINPATINFKTVLRSDIEIGDYVQLPPVLQSPYVALTPSSASPSPLTPSRNRLAFRGNFQIIRKHHFARFRQASGDAWTTSFDAVFTSTISSTGVAL